MVFLACLACSVVVAAPGTHEEPPAPLPPATESAESADPAGTTPTEPTRADSKHEDDEQAAESAEASEDVDPVLYERVRVVGAESATLRTPGSVSVLDEERLDEFDYEDVHRVLSQIPGVYLQDEEGYGLRPNIGFRGTGVERSAKITALEDGVLIAPAPYAAPSAYYFPTMGRMEEVEVRKGSASINQGPYTTGGVLNLISSSVPSEFAGRINLAAGGEDTLRGHAKVGGTHGRFGWLVETYQLETSGFKELDTGGDTGFYLEDYLIKLRYTSSDTARMFQALELKLGRTEQDGNETYLGLTDEDFRLTPFRRYAGSQQDRILTDHEQVQLRYFARPSQRVDLTATLYNNDFFRNWRKLEKVSGVGISGVLDDPANFAPELAILRGDAASVDDALAVRNNRRNYYSRGLDVVLGIDPGGSRVTHDLEIGARYHLDEEDRFQEEDGFRMTADGIMLQTSSGAPGSQSNRVSDARAFAAFARDTITTGRWTIVPGLRVEAIDYERIDYADADRTIASGTRDNSILQWIPGLGVSYAVDSISTVFASAHRGFTPPGPGTDADPEQSVNLELGYRRNQRALSTQVVGFFNDYQNLLGACTVSSGCSTAEIGDSFNGGEAEVFGVEAGLSYAFGVQTNRAVKIPINLAYTYTRTRFNSTFDSNFDAWGSVVEGDEFPYVPRHTGSLGVGARARRWNVFTNLIYSSPMRTVAGQGPPVDSEATDEKLVVDLSGGYNVHKTLELFLQVRNLTDERYIVARRPAGVRPGIGRTVLIGADWQF